MHTFFEMLGNFSFGDYFKRDAIQFRLGAAHQGLQAPPEKLWATVYQTDERPTRSGQDDGLPKERVVRIRRHLAGRSTSRTTFGRWPIRSLRPVQRDSSTTTAPASRRPAGLSPTRRRPLMRSGTWCSLQFNRDDKGVMHPLPKPSVDTGMGLERIAAVLQGSTRNYEIDFSRI